MSRSKHVSAGGVRINSMQTDFLNPRFVSSPQIVHYALTCARITTRWRPPNSSIISNVRTSLLKSFKPFDNNTYEIHRHFVSLRGCFAQSEAKFYVGSLTRTSCSSNFRAGLPRMKRSKGIFRQLLVVITWTNTNGLQLVYPTSRTWTTSSYTELLLTSHPVLSTSQDKVFRFNLLKKKRRLLYLKTQFVPRSKHFPTRL